MIQDVIIEQYGEEQFYFLHIAASEFRYQFRRIGDMLVFTITLQDELLLRIFVCIEEYENHQVKAVADASIARLLQFGHEFICGHLRHKCPILHEALHIELYRLLTPLCSKCHK